MKLSHQHADVGLDGYLRSTATGEVIHFALPRGQRRVHVAVVLGGRHLDGWLTLEAIKTDDPHDDVDVQLTLQAPAGPVGEDLDYTPLRPAAARYDVDGMPMHDGPVAAPDDATGDIAEPDDEPVREVVRTAEERRREDAEDTARRAAAEAMSADVDGALMLARPPAPAEPPAGTPPVERDPTAVPDGPNLRYDAAPDRHQEPWEGPKTALDPQRDKVAVGEARKGRRGR